MIITNNPEAIKLDCEDVSPEEINDLISILEKELKSANGIGLAAPQCGIAKKAAIVRIPTIGNEIFVNLINAYIEKKEDPFLFKGEGCLSFPGDLVDTTRYNEIVVSNGVEPKRFKATGLLAVAIQHEIDHTNGILFVDRAIKKDAQKSEIKHKIRPNDLCNCGSKIKYKKCCGKK